MTFLPIVERELRVAARRPATYRVRFWAVVVAMNVFGWLMTVLVRSHIPETYHGRMLFIGMGIVAFLHCLLSGAFVAADCLAGEKRDGTLGLLFLTDLKGYDVIFGKLAASSLNSFYGLLAFLPLMAIPLQLGGITGADLWRTALLLLNTLFFSVAAGMFVSVISRDERKALFGALLLVLGVCFVPLLVGGMVMEWLQPTFGNTDDTFWLLASPSPFLPGAIVLHSVSMSPMPPPPYAFALSMAVNHALSWLLLLLAGRILPRIWQDPTSASVAVRTRSRLEQWTYGESARRKEHRRRLLDRNPFLWLAARDRWKPAYVRIFLGAMTVIFLYAWRCDKRIMLDETAMGWFVMLTQTALKVWIAGEACFQLALDRRAGTLELLLSTPLTPREIVRGQWLALRRQFAVPILVLFALELLILPKSLGWPLTMMNQLLFVADAFALGWAGMWFGLTARSTTQALTKTVLLLLALPWALTLGGELLWDSYHNPHLFHASSRDVVILFWLVGGLAVDLVVGFLWARSRLASRFRIVATQDPGVKVPWWKRLASCLSSENLAPS